MAMRTPKTPRSPSGTPGLQSKQITKEPKMNRFTIAWNEKWGQNVANELLKRKRKHQSELMVSFYGKTKSKVSRPKALKLFQLSRDFRAEKLLPKGWE